MSTACSRRTPTATFLLAAALALPIAALPGGSSRAQQGGGSAAPPARIGNTYDWRHHDPTQAEAESLEQAQGLAPNPQQQSRDAAEVDQLYRQLMGSSPSAPGPGPAPGPAQPRNAPGR
ncbi:MAG TPA: hypothetical protein VE684_04340 [Crenalkalicoccus sp.]|jgi:hypothetical protein|nr:hypothetical protein [Crenalkalicoccus sp.]